jgi:hypothetical protein
MKSRSFLIISLALNLVLLAVVGWLPSRRSATNSASESVDSRPGAAITSTRKTSILENSTTNVVKIDWRMVESENYKQYIANLRTIGCPEETIRDIIIADVKKLFESRREQLFPATNKFEYWKGGNFLASLLDESKMEKQKVLNNEKRALLKELLGVDVPDKADLVSGTKTFDAMLDFLPEAKRTELMEFEQKFAARMAKNMKDIQRGDMEALKKLQAEKDAELLKLLSPEEKFEYDLRMSQSAMIMRMQMGDLDVNEQEFRELFKLRKQFDDEHGVFGVPSNRAEDREKRATAQKDLDAQTREVIGDDRFFEYKYSGDFERSSLKKIAEEHGISKPNAYRVFEIRNVAQEEAARLRRDKGLSPEQLQARLDEIRATTEREVGRLIGQPGLQAYIQEGSWLKNLNRSSGGSGNN